MEREAGLESNNVDFVRLTSSGQGVQEDGKTQSNSGQNHDLVNFVKQFIFHVTDILGQSESTFAEFLTPILRQQNHQLLDLIQVLKSICNFPKLYKKIILELLFDELGNSQEDQTICPLDKEEQTL